MFGGSRLAGGVLCDGFEFPLGFLCFPREVCNVDEFDHHIVNIMFEAAQGRNVFPNEEIEGVAGVRSNFCCSEGESYVCVAHIFREE